MAGIGGPLGEMLDSPTIEQLFLWGVLYGVISAVFQPELSEVTKGSWEFAVDSGIKRPASPQDLADWVVRNIIAKDTASAGAKASGVAPEDFHRMVEGAGEPPSIQSVMEWFRRGIIEWGTGEPGDAGVLTAIRTSRIYDYWSDTIRAGTLEPPSPADAVEAVLRNQISRDEGIALAFFGGLGVRNLEVPAGRDASDTERAFQLLLDTSGNPPSLTELLELARRRIIPWGELDPTKATPDPHAVTFSQGIFEGDAKDKWLPYYARLGEYLPPPRTIVTLLRDGVITTAQATELFTAQGLTAELAAAYVASATSEKVATHKDLALSTVEDLYFGHMIDHATAGTLIGNLGYSTDEVGFLLSLVDMRRSLAAVNSAVSRVGTYYTAHKIDRITAQSMLGRLGVPAEQLDQLLTTWDVTAQSNVKLLTEAQIVDAWSHAIMDQDTATAELGALGYTPYDAWVLLSIKAKGPIGTPPPKGPAEVT